MKRNLLVLLVLASIVMSFGSAFAGAPPSFGSVVKLGDLQADTWSSGMHGLIVNSSNVFAVRIGGLFSEKEVVMDKSNDGGSTWLKSTGIASGTDIKAYGTTIAINPANGVPHYAWATFESSPPYYNIYFSNGTSTTKVNGSVLATESQNIAVDKTGVIHIVFVGPDNQLFYTSSSNNGATFSDPTAITGAIGDWISFTADPDGNLFLVYMYYHNTPPTPHWDQKFMKSVGQSWLSFDACNEACSGDPSMAVYNSQKIYIATRDKIVATFDGGQTWILPADITPAIGCYISSLAVSSNGMLNVAWESANNVYFARTTKDPAQQITWSQPALAIPGGELPHVAVDSNGKAYIMATKDTANGNIAVFVKEQ